MQTSRTWTWIRIYCIEVYPMARNPCSRAIRLHSTHTVYIHTDCSHTQSVNTHRVFIHTECSHTHRVNTHSVHTHSVYSHKVLTRTDIGWELRQNYLHAFLLYTQCSHTFFPRTRYAHTLFAHTHYAHTLFAHTRYAHTLFAPYFHTLCAHLFSTHYAHTFSPHIICAPIFHTLFAHISPFLHKILCWWLQWWQLRKYHD